MLVCMHAYKDIPNLEELAAGLQEQCKTLKNSASRKKTIRHNQQLYSLSPERQQCLPNELTFLKKTSLHDHANLSCTMDPTCASITSYTHYGNTRYDASQCSVHSAEKCLFWATIWVACIERRTLGSDCGRMRCQTSKRNKAIWTISLDVEVSVHPVVKVGGRGVLSN